MEKSRQVLNTYEVLGEEFDKLVKREYTQLKQRLRTSAGPSRSSTRPTAEGGWGQEAWLLQRNHLLVFLLKGTTSTRSHLHSRACGDTCPNTTVL